MTSTARSDREVDAYHPGKHAQSALDASQAIHLIKTDESVFEIPQYRPTSLVSSRRQTHADTLLRAVANGDDIVGNPHLGPPVLLRHMVRGGSFPLRVVLGQHRYRLIVA